MPASELPLDEHHPPADGELFVRVLNRDGSSHRQPLTVFVNPRVAERHAACLSIPADIPQGYLPMGSNLVVDQARQTLANLAGGRDFPDRRWVVSKASFGTFDTVPRFTDVTLSPQPDLAASIVGGENEIEIASGVFKKEVLSVDWPQPFITRWEILLTPEEAVGYLIREMGLWTDGNVGGGGEVLYARKTFPAISKSGDFGLSFLWRVRF